MNWEDAYKTKPALLKGSTQSDFVAILTRGTDWDYHLHDAVWDSEENAWWVSDANFIEPDEVIYWAVLELPGHGL